MVDSFIEVSDHVDLTLHYILYYTIENICLNCFKIFLFILTKWGLKEIHKTKTKI